MESSPPPEKRAVGLVDLLPASPADATNAISVDKATPMNLRRWDATTLTQRGRPLDVLMGVAL
jgi:hypothetical protein